MQRLVVAGTLFDLSGPRIRPHSVSLALQDTHDILQAFRHLSDSLLSQIPRTAHSLERPLFRLSLRSMVTMAPVTPPTMRFGPPAVVEGEEGPAQVVRHHWRTEEVLPAEGRTADSVRRRPLLRALTYQAAG